MNPSPASPQPPTPRHTGEGAAAFTDLAGTSWRVRINVAAIRLVRERHSLDLLKILDREANPFAELADDPLRLCDVLWTLIAPQAEEAGIAELTWLENMAGDVLTSAAYALMEATVDFFPQHRRGPLAAMLAKMRTAEAALTTRLTAYANSPEIDQTIAAELAKMETTAADRLRAHLAERGN